jgi:hypothetical protein
VYNLGGFPGSTVVGVGEGLLTRFTTRAATAPEPAAVVSLASGAVLALIAFGRRNRTR